MGIFGDAFKRSLNNAAEGKSFAESTADNIADFRNTMRQNETQKDTLKKRESRQGLVLELLGDQVIALREVGSGKRESHVLEAFGMPIQVWTQGCSFKNITGCRVWFDVVKYCQVEVGRDEVDEPVYKECLCLKYKYSEAFHYPGRGGRGAIVELGKYLGGPLEKGEIAFFEKPKLFKSGVMSMYGMVDIWNTSMITDQEEIEFMREAFKI
jgi:hypothetical protein